MSDKRFAILVRAIMSHNISENEALALANQVDLYFYRDLTPSGIREIASNVVKAHFEVIEALDLRD